MFIMEFMTMQNRGNVNRPKNAVLRACEVVLWGLVGAPTIS